MKPKTFYLVLCFVGALAPYSQFVPWLFEHGLNAPLFLQQLSVNRISAFFALDVVVSAIVLLRFVAAESARIGLRSRWLVLLAALLVGVSLGLPLFLYLRETQLERGVSPVKP